MNERLRFFARGTALVADVHAQEHPTHSTRRFIGRRWQEVLPGQWAWTPTEAPQECDYHHDLVRAARDGDLWPADEATALVCKLAFDPTFGGEETETIKAWRAKHNLAQASAASITMTSGGKADSKAADAKAARKDEG